MIFTQAYCSTTQHAAMVTPSSAKPFTLVQWIQYSFKNRYIYINFNSPNYLVQVCAKCNFVAVVWCTIGRNYFECKAWIGKKTRAHQTHLRVSLLQYIVTASVQVAWIQTRVIVQKRTNWVKINGFLALWPWNLADDLEKLGHLFNVTFSFVHHFIAINEFKL